MKSFKIVESQNLTFMAQFFNLFNNVNFANPDNIKSSANFGQIARPAAGPRVMAFGLEYKF